MKRLFALFLCVICLGLCACNDTESSSLESEGEPITLRVPVVTINDEGVASWQAQEGAIGYEYKISSKDSISVGADVTQIKLLGGESICVRAIGDERAYLSSDWSDNVSKIIQLSEPVVSQKVFGSQILVSWELDERASSYQYRLNTGAPTPIAENSFLINASDAFYIQAVGDGTRYDNSEWVLVMAK